MLVGRGWACSCPNTVLSRYLPAIVIGLVFTGAVTVWGTYRIRSAMYSTRTGAEDLGSTLIAGSRLRLPSSVGSDFVHCTAGTTREKPHRTESEFYTSTGPGDVTRNRFVNTPRENPVRSFELDNHLNSLEGNPGTRRPVTLDYGSGTMENRVGCAESMFLGAPDLSACPWT